MKKYYKCLAIVALAALVGVGCIELLKFTHPESAQVNSQVDVSMDFKVTVEKDNGTFTAPIVVSMLMPSAWNKSQMSVTYSSPNLAAEALVNAPMRLTTKADKYKSLNSQPGPGDWNTETQKIFGYKGNYEPVQWVTFISTQAHEWTAQGVFTGTINIKFTTGSDNIKVNLAYAVSTDKDGYAEAVGDMTSMGMGNYTEPYYVFRELLFETTGGINETIDYRIPRLCSVNPASYTWKDIVSFNYDATVKVEDEDGKLQDQPLKGKNAVYMIATAIYDNAGADAEIKIDEISAKTLMKSTTKDKWFLYLYPHEFFNIPADKAIKKISFYLVDQTENIEVRPSGADSQFTYAENCK